MENSNKYLVYNQYTCKLEFDINTCLNDIIKEISPVILDGVPSFYSNGIYVPYSSNNVIAVIYDFLVGYPKYRKIILDEIKDYFISRKDTFPKINTCEFNRVLVSFSDCVFDVLQGKTYEYDKNFYLKQKLPYVYDPKAEVSDVENVIRVWANNDEKVAMLLEEIIASAMVNCKKLDKSFILLGPKDNGKSTFMKILELVVGSDNCSHIELKHFKQDKYVFKLNGKLLNCGDDIDDSILKDTSTFKKVVTHDSVNACELYENPISFYPQATLVFSANTMPYIKDRTGDINKRIIIVPFDNDLSFGKGDRKNDFMEIYSKTEKLQAFANVGIKALGRLMANNYQYTKLPVAEDKFKENLMFNDPARYFAAYEITKENIIGREPTDLYEEFKYWCKNIMDDKELPSLKSFSTTIMRVHNLSTDVKSIKNHSGKAIVKRIYVDKRKPY